MGRIVWKENKVLKIELKDGIFVLGQMIKSPYMIFYSHFGSSKKLDERSLKEQDILFFHAVTKQFLKSSNVEIAKNEPLTKYEAPNIWLKEDMGSRSVKIWENTPHEIQIFTLGEKGAKLIDKNISGEEISNKNDNSVFSKKNKNREFDKYELTSVEIYPNLNERLLLCYKFNKNVDPAKDILFNEDLPREYSTYVNIISGKVPLNDLGY